MDGSQLTGSSSSYARKYALNGLFAIDDTKDADFQNEERKDYKKAFSDYYKHELKEAVSKAFFENIYFYIIFSV